MINKRGKFKCDNNTYDDKNENDDYNEEDNYT